MTNANFGEISYAQPQKSGCLRYWWVALLVGFVFLVVPIGACIGIGYVGFSAVKAPMNAAIESANDNAEVKAKFGGTVSGTSNFNVNDFKSINGSGGANIRVGIRGPNAKGQLEGRMELSAGTWSPTDLIVTCDDGTEIKIP